MRALHALLLTSWLCPSLLTAQSGWSPPVLEPTLNSTAADSGPQLSIDGLTLYFSSFRPGNWEIFSATRAAPGLPWSAPVQEVALGDPSTDDQPFLAATGLEIYLSSLRTGGAGGFDIMRATRATAASPWNTPTFVTELNGSGSESSPSLTADGLELYMLTTGWGAPFAPNNAIFRATRPSASSPFGTPTVVSELLTPNTHRDVEISADGLGIVYTEFVSPRTRVFHAERTSRSLPFGPPAVFTEFDTTGTSIGVFSFTRSQLGDEAILAAGFAAAAGGQELMTTRFDGLAHSGLAATASTMNLFYRDSANPGKTYVFGAALGNTGFALGTRTVPLDPDFLLQATLGQNVPGFTTGWVGVLDGNGQGGGTLTNALPGLAGFTFHVGAFTFDPAAPFGVATIANEFAVMLQ